MAYQIRFGQRVRNEIAACLARIRPGFWSASRLSPRTYGWQDTGLSKVAGAATVRLRVGDYRVIYLVLGDERVVVVARVARWDESTYRGLR